MHSIFAGAIATVAAARIATLSLPDPAQNTSLKLTPRGRLLWTGVLAAVFALACSTAHAGKKNDTLTWLTPNEPPTYEFYAVDQRPVLIIAHHVWDTLLVTDPVTGELQPHLATSITFSTPTTLEVKLRQGVKFHNGDPFTADDVVYTITWQNDPNNKSVRFRSRTDWIRQAEKIDTYTVRLHLHRPYAPAKAMLAANLPIYPAAYTKAQGSEGMSRAPVGTGPYRVTEVARGKHIVLERNQDYFGGAKSLPKIGKVVVRFVPEYGTQIAELLAGNADLIWQVPKDQAARLKDRRGVNVVVGDTMRFALLQFDITGRPGAAAEALRKLEVRQAISHAINRKAIVDKLLGGGTVLDLTCYPSQIGCASKYAVKYGYDPVKAKQLLAAAGYPNGFDIDLYANRDRQLAEAMMGDLAKVGIRVRLQWLQYAALADKARKGEVPIAFRTQGSSSINDVEASAGRFFDKGADDSTRDDRLTDLMKKAEAELDPAKRLALYDEAHQLTAKNAYSLPLWSYAYFYAMNGELQFQPTPDEIPHFNRASWK
jgi:peptide/nickel transport system substrate-binding protein